MEPEKERTFLSRPLSPLCALLPIPKLSPLPRDFKPYGGFILESNPSWGSTPREYKGVHSGERRCSSLRKQ